MSLLEQHSPYGVGCTDANEKCRDKWFQQLKSVFAKWFPREKIDWQVERCIGNLQLVKIKFIILSSLCEESHHQKLNSRSDVHEPERSFIFSLFSAVQNWMNICSLIDTRDQPEERR